MSRHTLRRHVRLLYRAAMSRRTRSMDAGDLGRLALVFSPHPDDETLGCGGTIAKKRAAGAAIKIVIMTDGGLSHSRFMSREQLKAIRASEAIAAAEVLGLAPEDVVFLEFNDGALAGSQAEATRAVRDILGRERPAEVFLPYSFDGPADHTATNRIVRSAVQASRAAVVAYEYPVWFWQHWPWAPDGRGGVRALLSVMRRSAVSGVRLLKDFTCAVDIRDVLETKRTALERYASQMRRLVPDPSWRTLADVSDGDFLQCFFQEREIFHRYLLAPSP